MAPRPQTVKALATLARMHMDTEVDDAKKYELKMELDEEIRELKHLVSRQQPGIELRDQLLTLIVLGRWIP